MIDDKKMAQLFYREILQEDEYRIKQLFRDRVQFDYIVDIGANVGWFSCLARMLYSNAKILAVEPSIVNCPRLKENTQHLNIDILNLAIGAGDDQKLYMSDNNKNHGATRAFESKSNGTVEVSCIELKSLFRDYITEANNIFMKIDCEGGENYILDTKNFELLERCRFIAMEVHKFTNREKLNKFIEHMERTHIMDKKDDNPRQTTIYWERK